MLISGLHPRVSGSVDAESGLGANISSTFSVWALRLLKTAIHSVEGQEKDKAGERLPVLPPHSLRRWPRLVSMGAAPSPAQPEVGAC